MMKPTERLYFQYAPDSSSIKELVQIQKQALKANPNARPMPLDKLHLTLLHIGIIQEVYEEIRSVNDNLPWDEFNDTLIKAIDGTQQTLPTEVDVSTSNIMMLGAHHDVLAVGLSTTEELKAAHGNAYQHLISFLSSCGIEHPVAFIHGSRNLRYSLNLIPHITLLRAARRAVDLSLEHITLRVSLLPVVYK